MSMRSAASCFQPLQRSLEPRGARISVEAGMSRIGISAQALLWFHHTPLSSVRLLTVALELSTKAGAIQYFGIHDVFRNLTGGDFQHVPARLDSIVMHDVPGPGERVRR